MWKRFGDCLVIGGALILAFYLGSWYNQPQHQTTPCLLTLPVPQPLVLPKGLPLVPLPPPSVPTFLPHFQGPTAVHPPTWGLVSSENPLPGISAALGWRNYSAQDALLCGQRLGGGLGFVGDSHMRFALNTLLADLGRPPLPLNKPGNFSDAVEAFELPPGDGGGRVYVGFRFAPSLLRAADAVEDMVLGRRSRERAGPRFRALAVASAHWDIVGEEWAYRQGCVPHCRPKPPPPEHFLEVYGGRMGHFLQRIRAGLAQAEAQAGAAAAAGATAGGGDAAPTAGPTATPPPPFTLLWRTATSTRAQVGGATLARFSAVNALAKKALGAWTAGVGVGVGVGIPRWRILESEDLLPPRLVENENFIAPEDGSHPSPMVSVALMQGMLNELCNDPWDVGSVEALGEGLPAAEY